ncbi:ABC transporter ATP-binding protein [Halioxenophilus sp. WMMB6]|uniref:ABC transporter ATP-binding protein n=1 Tax=Halioxenophilus sp. WMMB6 TaxID=3073815 RepID=UPI00295F0347|nr:ABC transporter ATP-binding protein [Halioxenophilus sp. WMMB6]
MNNYRLELVGLSKSFAEKRANEAVSLNIAAGEIHALVGENGAGKSTLMGMIYGLLKPDAGSIVWEGREQSIKNPEHARKLGIGIVMQHFALFESMSVLENLYLHTSLTRTISRAALAEQARRVAAEFGFELDLEAVVSHLSVGEQQRIEILRCLLQEQLKLLILDEPTAVLSPDETDALLQSLKKLAAQGTSIIYISHKLKEITALADRATVLRQGRVVAEVIPSEVSEETIARLMMGGELAEKPNQHSAAGQGHCVLQLKQASSTRHYRDADRLKTVDLSVYSGQVLGVAGIAGNGQNALVDAISGESQLQSGEVHFAGTDISKKSLAWRYARGISAVASERLTRSVSIGQTLTENYYLKARLARPGQWVQWRAMRAQTEQVIAQFEVSCSGANAIAGSLSGGNLQKFIMGRELAMQPKLLVCHSPTWGVDIHSARLIRSRLQQLAKRGAAVVVISEDLDELLEVADTLAVLFEGQLSQVRPVAQWSVAEVGHWMAGLHDSAPVEAAG